MATTLSHLIVRLDADIDGLTRGVTAADRAFVGLGQKMQKVGRGMSVAVTLPLTAIGVAATKMASDAEEAANKFDVVMGDSAERVNARLRELHDTIPLTTAQMQGLAAGVQDLLVPMGVVRNRAADMSATMVELAGDLGSFNNVAPDQVLEAMKSALAGSSEPMRRFGVDTREAALKAIALRHGLIEAGDAMTSTARAQAVLLAIQKDSTDAIGDAARTADSAANSFKFLVREAKELAITIGDILLPVVTPMVRRLTDVMRTIRDLPHPLQITAIAIGALAAAMGPLLLALGTFMTLLPGIKAALIALGTPTAGTIGLVIAAVAALGFAATVVVKNWDVLALKMSLVWAAIKAATFDAIDGILAALEKLTGWIPRLGDKVTDLRGSFNEFATDSLAKSGEAILNLERQLSDTFTPAISETTKQTEALADALDNVAVAAGKVAALPAVGVRLVGAEAGPPIIKRSASTGAVSVSAEGGFLGPVTASAEAVREQFTRLEQVLFPAISGVKRFSDGVKRSAGNLLSQFGPQALAVAVLFDIVKGALEPLQPVIDALRRPLEIVGTLIGQTLAPILELFVPIVELLAIAFTYAQEATGLFIKGLGWLIDKLIGWFTDWGDKLQAFGQDLVDNSRAAREAIRAQDEATESLRQLTEQVIGAVQGFKIAQFRFAATAPTGPSGLPDTGGGGTPGGGGPGGTVIPTSISLGTINIMTSGDGQETYRNLYDELDQRTRGDEAARALFRTLPAPVG